MVRKQRQKQSQKQTVIVNISEKRKRRPSKRKRSAPRDAVSMTQMQQSLPPPVIYQSSYSIPYPVYKDSVANPAVSPAVGSSVSPALVDVGQVGTEGRVEILERPTKKEQQSEFITPVASASFPSQLSAFKDTEAQAQAISRAFTKVQADMSIPQAIAPTKKPRKAYTRRSKKEMSETNLMGGEDIMSRDVLPMAEVKKQLAPIDDMLMEMNALVSPQKEPPQITSNVENVVIKKLPDYPVDKPPLGPVGKRYSSSSDTESDAPMSMISDMTMSLYGGQKRENKSSWDYLQSEYLRLSGNTYAKQRGKKEQLRDMVRELQKVEKERKSNK